VYIKMFTLINVFNLNLKMKSETIMNGYDMSVSISYDILKFINIDLSYLFFYSNKIC